MKYKEMIIKSFDTFTTERIEDCNGNLIQAPFETLPLSITYFLANTSALFALIACAGDPELTARDFADIASGGDFVRHVGLFVAWHGFVGWLLQQEIRNECDEDGLLIWYELEQLLLLWNEWVVSREAKA